MIFDAVKRFLGVRDAGTTSSHENEPPSIPNPRANRVDELVPYTGQMPPDISEIESDIALVHRIMEQQMRSMMGSFGFSFGNPFSGFGLEDESQFGPFFQFSSGIEDIPHHESSPHPGLPVHPEAAPPALDPRDQVLKPQFRSGSSRQWNGQDQNLDERLNNEGLGSVIGELKPPPEAYERNNPIFDSFSSIFGNGMFRNSLFGNGPFSHASGFDSGSVMSSSTVTVYSNVNGHRSVEKIVRHPDGKIERTVISDDGKPDQPL